MPSTPAGAFSNATAFPGQDSKSHATWPRAPGQPGTGETPMDSSATTDFGALAATPASSRPITGHQNLLNGLWSQMNHGYSEGNPEVPSQAMQQMPQQPQQAFDLNNMFGIQDLQWDSSLLLPVSIRETITDTTTDSCFRDSTASVTSSFLGGSFTPGSALVSCESSSACRSRILNAISRQIAKLYTDGFTARQSIAIIFGAGDSTPNE